MPSAGESTPLLGRPGGDATAASASSGSPSRVSWLWRGPRQIAHDGPSSLPSPPPSRPTSTAAPLVSSASSSSPSSASRLSPSARLRLFLAIFIVGYAYGLESQVRSAYQPYATSSFGLHSYTATINVLRSVVAVAVQPTAAKLADVAGRFEAVVAATLLYVAGIAIEASATSVRVFCAGSVIYQAGYTAVVLLMEVLIADTSSMRERVALSYIPAVPFIVNTWISGNITSAVLDTIGWRWGIGMWAVIYPIASLPLLASLFGLRRRTRTRVSEDRSGEDGFGNGSSTDSLAAADLKVPSGRKWGTELLEQLDLGGLLTLVGSFSLVLAPLTGAGGESGTWRDPRTILPLVVGLILFPVFVVWEKRGAKTPLVPFALLTDRGVWAALAVRTLLNFAWYTQGNYLYTILVVAFDFSVVSATRILSFFSFFGVVSGVLIGMVIMRVRRLKYIIVTGTCIFMGAFAILIAHPGGPEASSHNGMLAAQVILGLAGGLFAYPTQASIQAAAKPEHVAILTGLYLSFYNVGGALGTCLAGSIWSQTLYKTLESNLAFQPNATLARAMYDSPFSVIPDYPVGTEIRTAIISSYRHVQLLLCISGLCVCIPMIGFALALRNPHLSEERVQPDAEGEDEEH